MALALLFVAPTAPAVGASPDDPCPNAAIRAQQHAQHLSDCRAYEMVSPPDKAGYPIPYSERSVKTGLTRLSRDGGAAIYSSYGAFAGATSGMPQTYRAARGPEGWRSRVASPNTVTRDPVAPMFANYWTMTTPDLGLGLVATQDPLDGDDDEAQNLYTSTIDGVPTLVSAGEDGERLAQGELGAANQMVMSDDGSSVAFVSNANLVAADVNRTVGQDVYLRSGGTTHLLNRAADGTLLNRCGSVLGGSSWIIPVETTRNAVSPDGRQAIFTVPSGAFDFSDTDCLSPARIFIWRDGEGLVEVSASEASVPDAQQMANYQGASKDGSRVFFTSAERLIDGVSSGGLYVFDRDAPVGSRLTQAVAVTDISVVKTSDDGSTVYFASSENVAPGGDPNIGNGLFVYRETSGEPTVKWIADDLAGDFSSLLTALREESRDARISRDGTVLSFVTGAALTGFDNVDPRTGQATLQVFVYDDRVGLRCASCDPAGQRPEGSRVTGDAWVGPTMSDSANPPMISEDNERVFFTSPDQLVPEDVNGKRDVYEFSDGRVHLISSGRGRDHAHLADVSASGDTVLFATSESLVAQDVDAGDVDMYVARIGGGYAAAEPESERSCSGDACQGTPGGGPALPTAGSVTFDAAAGVSQAAGALRVSGARSVSGVAARLRVRVPGRGTIRVSGSRVASRSKAAGKAGTYSLPVRLSRKARRALSERGRLSTVVVVRFADASGESRSVRVRVTFKAKGSK